MSKVDFKVQNKKLLKAIEKHVSDEGEVICSDSYESVVPFLRWLDYLNGSELTGQCDEFLESIRASIIESIACVSLGLVRPAIFSMRVQVDLVFSWLYFKDHPVEWQRVEGDGEGFMLKGAVLKYLELNVPAFSKRFSSLLAAKIRREGDPYRLLSAHVHSQIPSVMPKLDSLASVVRPIKTCKECVLLQAEVVEYVGDVLLAVFADKWASLPDSIVVEAQLRLGVEKSAKVFG